MSIDKIKKNVLLIIHKRVIPNHFNKSLQVTLLELNETWYVNSSCGFMKPDKIPLLVYCMVSWLKTNKNLTSYLYVH